MAQQQPQRHAQQTEEKKKGILDQMSMPAVLAAVLTSITSFMFSSKLGLTGSLIGAALAAAVSTIASQLYNAMINSSVEKIQDLSQQMHAPAEAQHAAMSTQVLERAQTGTPLAPQELKDEAARRHTVTIMRRTFAVAVIAALVALLAYGIVVRVATQGQGIGPTSFDEMSIEAPVQQEEAAAKEAEAAAQEAVPVPAPEPAQPQYQQPAPQPMRPEAPPSAAQQQSGPQPSFCYNCGKPISPGAKFCRNCGTKLE